MEDKDIIYSVQDIFEHERFKDKKYRIPHYQRGYKWTPDNVLALLNDIWMFKGNDEQFYCLQNITIIPSKDKQYFNVIDGQQRLTTLSIILSYLGEAKLVKNRLIYEIRESTSKYLEEDIYSRECWSGNYDHSAQHQDEYYIMMAAKTIADWFEPNGKLQINQQEFKEKLLSKTKLIVNEVKGNEYQTFSNLNGVRVPLDASDLIRAMLVTYSVKEGKIDVDIAPYRVRMGAEIDSFALVWSNSEFNSFYRQFLPEKLLKKAEELRFDYTEHPINLLYLLFLLKEKGEENISLASFEEYLKKNPDAFSNIKEFNAVLQEWYNDTVLYHFLGYLFFNFKNKNDVKFTNIYSLWSGCSSRTDFSRIVKKIAAECLLLGFKPTELDIAEGKRSLDILYESLRFNLSTNWYTHDYLPRILILCDILISIKSKSLSRIPVSFLKINNEDREHINCQTPKDEELNNRKRWIDDLEVLEKYEVHDSDKTKYLSNIQSLKTRIEQADKIDLELKQEIIESLTQFGLNSIGNIVLLNLSVNRGYGNEQFRGKRTAIIDNYFNNTTNSKHRIKSKNAFIRPFTIQTFLSNLNDTDSCAEKNEWTLADIKSNAQSIADSIKSFIEEVL